MQALPTLSRLGSGYRIAQPETAWQDVDGSSGVCYLLGMADVGFRELALSPVNLSRETTRSISRRPPPRVLWRESCAFLPFSKQETFPGSISGRRPPAVAAQPKSNVQKILDTTIRGITA
jgi:hypothetical protein